MKKKKYPDFIGLGTRRCSSSWLHRLLNTHPDIGKPPNGLHYFSNNKNKGEDWYINQLKEYSDFKYILEFSVSYLYPEYSDKAAKGIFEDAPDAKLFACIRHPVDRAFSDYLRSIRVGEIKKDINFLNAIKLKPEFFNRGRYANLLKPYYKYFHKEKIKILFHEDAANNPINFVNDLATFLGIPNSFNEELVISIKSTQKTIKSDLLNKIMLNSKKTIDNIFNLINSKNYWNNLKSKNLKYWWYFLETNYKKIELDKSIKKKLTKEFTEDINFIENITNRNLDHWYE